MSAPTAQAAHMLELRRENAQLRKANAYLTGEVARLKARESMEPAYQVLDADRDRRFLALLSGPNLRVSPRTEVI